MTTPKISCSRSWPWRWKMPMNWEIEFAIFGWPTCILLRRFCWLDHPLACDNDRSNLGTFRSALQHLQVPNTFKSKRRKAKTHLRSLIQKKWGKKKHNVIINRTRGNLERIWTYPTVIRIAGASINASTTPHFDGWIQRFVDKDVVS